MMNDQCTSSNKGTNAEITTYMSIFMWGETKTEEASKMINLSDNLNYCLILHHLNAQPIFIHLVRKPCLEMTS